MKKKIFITVIVCVLCIAGGAALAINYSTLQGLDSESGNLTNTSTLDPLSTSAAVPTQAAVSNSPGSSLNTTDTPITNSSGSSSDSSESSSGPSGSSSSGSSNTPTPTVTPTVTPTTTPVPDGIEAIEGTWVGSKTIDYSPIVTASTNYQAVFYADNSAEATMTVNISDVDLSSVNLSRINLSRIDLSRITVPGFDLSGIDLSNVNLSEIELQGEERTVSRPFIWSYAGSNYYIGTYNSDYGPISMIFVINGDTLTLTVNPVDMGFTTNPLFDMDVTVELHKTDSSPQMAV
jgi:hypothetical protein